MIMKYPDNLEKWVELLSSMDMPILRTTHEEIIKQQKNVDNLSLRDIALFIRHDPLLSLKLLKHQEHIRSQQQTTDITTIERVLLMSGVTGFFNTFCGSLHLEDSLAHNTMALEACHQSCARAFFASQLANSMSKYHRDLDPNEIVTAALLHETAEILLWPVAPVLMLKIKAELKNNSTLRSKDAQTQILGCTLNELQQRLSNQWHLPKILSHLTDENFLDEPRVKIVQLATSIARHTEWTWDSEYNNHDLELCAELLNISKDEAHRLIVNTALLSAKQWQWYGVQPSAARLLEHS